MKCTNCGQEINDTPQYKCGDIVVVDNEIVVVMLITNKFLLEDTVVYYKTINHSTYFTPISNVRHATKEECHKFEEKLLLYNKKFDVTTCNFKTRFEDGDYINLIPHSIHKNSVKEVIIIFNKVAITYYHNGSYKVCTDYVEATFKALIELDYTVYRLLPSVDKIREIKHDLYKKEIVYNPNNNQFVKIQRGDYLTIKKLDNTGKNINMCTFINGQSYAHPHKDYTETRVDKYIPLLSFYDIYLVEIANEWEREALAYDLFKQNRRYNPLSNSLEKVFNEGEYLVAKKGDNIIYFIFGVDNVNFGELIEEGYSIQYCTSEEKEILNKSLLEDGLIYDPDTKTLKTIPKVGDIVIAYDYDKKNAVLGKLTFYTKNSDIFHMVGGAGFENIIKWNGDIQQYLDFIK